MSRLPAFKFNSPSHLILQIIIILAMLLNQIQSCSIGEFECGNRQCIQSDRYCDGFKDCRDGTDEMNGCSACNRTYYGRLDFTYRLSIIQNMQQSNCVLTFIAAGGSFGDIVQLAFPLDSSSTSTCERKLQIQESNSVHKSNFCISSSFNFTKSNYFSENTKLTLSFNSSLELVYKFLPKNSTNSGSLLQGTMCSVLYENCDSSCVIRNPNYPGIYSSNITCYFAIREMKSSLKYIKLNGAFNIGESGLKDDTCKDTYVIVYDGYSTRDRILIKFCGSGKLPNVVSSSNEMLIEFFNGASITSIAEKHAAGPLGLNLLATSISIPTAQIQDSTSSISSCSQTISSFHELRGNLFSPAHTLPPNSSCIYNFQGSGNQRIWISFLKFSFKVEDNDTKLILKENSGKGILNRTYSYMNSPPLCELKLLKTATRPCSSHESLLSTTNQLSIQLAINTTSITTQPKFLLEYEFVEDSNCGFHFKSTSGEVISTRSIFDFGRGGKKRLVCKYKFEENTKIILKDVILRGPSCRTTIDMKTHRSTCQYTLQNQLLSRIEFKQFVNGTSVSKQCFCGEYIRLPIILTSTLASELVLIVENMGVGDDATSFLFSGTYDRLPVQPYQGQCPDPVILTQSTKFKISKKQYCESYILLKPNPSIYFELIDSCCIVHTAYSQTYTCNDNFFSPGFANYTLSNEIVLELVENLNLNFVQVFNPLEPNYNYISDHFDTCGGFKCSSISACVDKTLFCDGLRNCPEGEDEMNCNGIDYTFIYLVVLLIIVGIVVFWGCCKGCKVKRVIRKGEG